MADLELPVFDGDIDVVVVFFSDVDGFDRGEGCFSAVGDGLEESGAGVVDDDLLVLEFDVDGECCDGAVELLVFVVECLDDEVEFVVGVYLVAVEGDVDGEFEVFFFVVFDVGGG